jgi:predicted CXXCH cytochrome family protein
VHGIALLKNQDTAAPACNDCHGNHGATPPGVISISYVCGECHALNAEYFAKSPHAPAFEQSGIPQCEVCHGNHNVPTPSDEMLQVGKNSICEECHSEEKGNEASGYAVAQQMYAGIQKLQEQANSAELLLNDAEQKGMDVSDARFKIKDIPGALIKARTATHMANLAEFDKEIDAGIQLAQEGVQAGQKAIGEYSFRRRGLGIASLFITLLAVVLYLKIRNLEKQQGPE